jgi:Fur family transcriptional regulator, ferric uptake regulator
MKNKDDRANQWLAHMKENGYRLTGARSVIVEILAGTNIALEASDIHKIANQKYPSVGLVSVYRTLSILEHLGLIQRIHQPEKCQAYITAFTSHEHLILCNHCGRVEFFTGDDIGVLAKRVENECDYEIQGHWLQFFGICKNCQDSTYQADNN